MTKKTITIMAFTALCGFNVEGLWGQNLVPNGDFELGPDGSSYAWEFDVDSVCGSQGFLPGPDLWNISNGTPDRWVEGDIWCLNGSDSDSAKSGTAFIFIGNTEACKVTLVAPIEKDSAYRLSYYARYDSLSGSLSPPYRFAIRFNNNIDSILSPFLYTSQWQYYDTVFNASANATEIQIAGIISNVNNGYSSGADIDNVSLEKVAFNSVNNQAFSDLINIYPNPTNGKVTIKHTNASDLTIKVYDLYGEEILKINKLTGNTQSDITLAPYPKGLYILKLQSGNDSIAKKIILL